MLTYLKQTQLKTKFTIDKDFMHRQITKLSQFMKTLQERLQKEAFNSFDFSIISDSSKEFYHIHQEQDKIKVKGSLKSICYALNQLSMAVRSRHLAYFLGDSTPRFSLRPLWLKKSDFSFLTEKTLFESLFKDGYNALIVEVTLTDLGSEELKNFSLHCQAYGIALYLHLSNQLATSPCPVDPSFKIYLQKSFRLLKDMVYEGIVWESQLHHADFLRHSLANSFTEKEMVLEEIQGLETLIGEQKTLIYYLPTLNEQEAQRQAQWLVFIAHRVSSQTVLAFSSVAGEPSQDHLPLHPIWDVLQQLEDPIYTPLLPLFNGGCLRQGEGMWPILNFERLDEIVQRCQRHQFAGLAILTRQLPQEKGLLACNLWVCGQALWHAWPVYFLVQLWFKSERPDLDFKRFAPWLKKISYLALDLSLFQAEIEANRSVDQLEEYRCKGESVLAQLTELSQQIQHEKAHTSSAGVCFKDYYLYFMRDARRIVLLFMQSHQLPTSTLLIGQDLQPAFWTEVLSGTDQGIRGQIKIILKKTLKIPPLEELIQQIYRENFLI
jgi:hypothetical protein